MFFSRNDILVPALISTLAKLVNATICVDLCPRHVITEFRFGVMPSHERTPSMLNKWFVKRSLDHRKDGGNVNYICPPIGK